MRLGVYSILKNERNNIEAFLDAVLPELHWSDSLTLVDTGSTDGTRDILWDRISNWQRKVDAEYHASFRLYFISVSPWRFDDARNAALALVPPDMDMAWSLDIDERPQPGWRNAIEEAYQPGATRIRYKFNWSHQENGEPAVIFWADKLHARNGFHWKGIAHEWLVADGPERHVFSNDLVVDHYQDLGVERKDRDMALMERAIAELPDDDRLQHYYARQLYFCGRNVEASEAFQKHLANPKATWRHERAESMLYLSKVGGNDAWNRQWLYRALAECPERREVWVEAAKFEADQGNYRLAMTLLGEASKLPTEAYYLSRPEARDEAISMLALDILEREAKSEGSPEVHPGGSPEEGSSTEAA